MTIKAQTIIMITITNAIEIIKTHTIIANAISIILKEYIIEIITTIAISITKIIIKITVTNINSKKNKIKIQ